jgi:hypothetical protein
MEKRPKPGDLKYGISKSFVLSFGARASDSGLFATARRNTVVAKKNTIPIGGTPVISVANPVEVSKGLKGSGGVLYLMTKVLVCLR